MDNDFQKTLVDTIIDLIKANTPDGWFREYYYGSPDDIPPASSLPCLAVDLLRTNVSYGPTGLDKVRQTVLIRIIYNVRNEYGNGSGSEVLGARALEEFAQGINPTNSEYDTRTILGILRKNLTLESNMVFNEVDIEYGVVPQPDGYTAECHVTLTVEKFRTVTGRV